MKKIEEHEELITEINTELTETQAKEAILEAENSSIKKLLDRASAVLEEEQIKSKQFETSNAALVEKNSDLEAKLQILQDEITNYTKELEKKEKEICMKSLSSSVSNFYSEQSMRVIISQLRMCRESIEDWTIISKMAFEIITRYHHSWVRLENMFKTISNFESICPMISFVELTSMDSDSFPESYDEFLSLTGALAKCSYDKLSSISDFHPDNFVEMIQTQLEIMKNSLSLRLEFLQ